MMDENSDEGKIRLSPFGQWVARKAAMLATGGGSDKATAGGYIGNDSKRLPPLRNSRMRPDMRSGRIRIFSYGPCRTRMMPPYIPMGCHMTAPLQPKKWQPISP